MGPRMTIDEIDIRGRQICAVQQGHAAEKRGICVHRAYPQAPARNMSRPATGIDSARWTGALTLLATMAIVSAAVRAEESPWLLGDWAGQRTALADKGVEFEMVLTLEGVQNVRGGMARSSRGLLNLDLIMDARGEALGLSDQGDLHVYLLGNAGGTPTEMIGDLQTTSNIEAPNTFKVYELWWQQRHAGGSLAWLVGLHDYNATFDALESAGLFTNSSFGISPANSQVPPAIFPTTSLAVVASLWPGERCYLHAGVYDGIPGDPGDDKGTHVILDRDDGIFYALEGGLQNEETGRKLALGGWYRSTDFADDFSGASHGSNDGYYLIGETNLSEHWAGFFQLGQADKNRNQVGFYAGAGVTYASLLCEDDTFGVGVAHARSTDAFRAAVPGADGYETAFECTYEFHPVGWLTIQPDLQFIRNPGMDPTLNDAVVLSLRAYIAF